jgi:hypothetical protein
MTTTPNESFDYATATALSAAARTAFDTIDAILALDDPSCDISIAFRSMLIDRDDSDFSDFPAAFPHIAAMRDALTAIDARIAYPYDESNRQRLSMLLLDFSLCPMHCCDYAICFDDDDAECAAIRALFPSHDT